MSIDFTSQRKSYEQGKLLENTLPDLPYPLLTKWIDDALQADIDEPYAFSLATCGADQRPSVRTLLMREIYAKGSDIVLVFYSNYDSQKGQDLAQNPFAEALFFWQKLERQVRLAGRVARLSRADSQAYFESRPKDSQLAAWVSAPQSGVVDSRETMAERFNALQDKFCADVPLPEFWGGYTLTVDSVEFWQGRANRMHDRICYKLGDNGWRYERLLP